MVTVTDPMATSPGCFRTDECRPRSRAQRRRDELSDRELMRDGRWLI
jgi:hypothetical protein